MVQTLTSRIEARTFRGYKLLKLSADGLHPLFIDQELVLKCNEWYRARARRTKGYKYRPGWHVLVEPKAPHLSMAGSGRRVVEVDDWEFFQRPESQGGLWVLAKWMRIIKP